MLLLIGEKVVSSHICHNVAMFFISNAVSGTE